MVSPIGTKASEEQCYMGTYHSTRGRTLSCSSKVAIRTGIAPDGGLFVSDELGAQQVDISSLADKSYFEIAQDVLGMLLNDYTAEEISACVDEAYRGTFASEEVTPLVKLDAAPGADAPQTYVMELFGGPTSAFKDVALQMLPRLMARTSAKDGGAERIMIVTATSGDTGKAALAGFADAPGTGITVFYPEGKVSRVQNLQMSTQEGDNVAVCGIRGNFDDAQSAVKRIFADKELAERLEAAGTVLSSANSINVGRLVPQVVYYFAAYAQLLRAGADPPLFGRPPRIVAQDALRADTVPAEFAGEFIPGLIPADDAESERAGAERRNIAHDIARPAETAGAVHDIHHRHRRLRRNPADPAPEIDIEHEVAEHRDPALRKRPDDFGQRRSFHRASSGRSGSR